jgi:hypothetical protein
MSTAYSGVDGTCFMGSIDMDVRGYSAEVSDDGFDATTTADAGWEDTLDSTRKVTGTVDIFFNASKNFFAAPTLLFSRSPNVYPTLKLNVGGTKFLQGSAKLKNGQFKSATKDGITLSFNFTSRGAWALPT